MVERVLICGHRHGASRVRKNKNMVAAGAADALGSRRHQRPPHIVIILADDFAYEMWPRANNDAMRSLLPTLARHFVDDGFGLERHYTYKLCAPARASLLSGRWPHRAYELRGGMRACKGLSPGITNLAEKLRGGANYATHFVGKVRAKDTRIHSFILLSQEMAHKSPRVRVL